MKFSWYWSRVKYMSFWEVCIYRPLQLIQRNLIDRYFPNLNQLGEISCNNKFTFPRYSERSISLLLKRFHYTDKFKIFEKYEIDLSDKINWRKDYKTSTVSPLKFYADINRQDYNEHGDIKYLAELSRLYFLPFMASHQVITDERKGDQIKEILNTWSNQNPFLKSIHWTSGIEIAIRSINIIYCHIILRIFGLLDSEIDNLIKEHIRLNYSFLKNHLSKYSSANNHLIAELAGLVIISTYFDNQDLRKERSKWENYLYRELFRQTSKDGCNNEKSFRYHAEVADHFLNAFLFLERSGLEIPHKVTERFKKMLLFIDDVIYKGNVNEFSDSDDGYLIFPYLDETFSIYQSLLDSAKIKFDLPVDHSSNIDFRNYILFGENAKNLKKNELHKNSSDNGKLDKLYPEGGYCFMYDEKHKARVVFDVGKIGDNLTSAHGHSDLLHFTFEYEDKPIIIDPGTFQYHSKDQKFRDYFRGITAHNTISVNGLNHATPCTRMGWIKRPCINVEEVEFGKVKSTCEASHNAFNVDSIKSIHRRKIIFHKKKKVINIQDSLLKKNGKSDTLIFYLHFNPELKVRRGKASISLFFPDEPQKNVTIKNKYFDKAKIIRGDYESPFGLYSPSFDKMVPSSSLKFELEFNSDFNFKTEISYSKIE